MPTAVLLENFEAVTQPDHVLVTWEMVVTLTVVVLLAAAATFGPHRRVTL